MGYEDKRAGVFGEGFGKRFFGEVVQVVGRLVEYEQIALFLHERAQLYAHLFAARKGAHRLGGEVAAYAHFRQLVAHFLLRKAGVAEGHEGYGVHLL